MNRLIGQTLNLIRHCRVSPVGTNDYRHWFPSHDVAHCVGFLVSLYSEQLAHNDFMPYNCRLIGSLSLHIFPGEEPLPLSQAAAALLFICGFVLSLLAERWLSRSPSVRNLLPSQPHLQSTGHRDPDSLLEGTRPEDAGPAQRHVAEVGHQPGADYSASTFNELDVLRVYMFTYAIVSQEALEGVTRAYEVMGLSNATSSGVEEEQADMLTDPEAFASQMTLVLVHGMNINIIEIAHYGAH